MKTLGHLLIEELKLQPGQEWMDASGAWHFVRVHRGAAYWLSPAETRPLVEGELLVVAPDAGGSVRASQIGEVVLHGFSFAPDLLYGFFTLAEGHFFETVAGKSRKVRFLPSTHPATQRFTDIAAQDAPHTLSERAKVLEIVTAVFDEEIARHRPPASPSTTALHRFKQLITQMPDAEIINHSPEELARLCGCSPRHFNRLFREHFAVSARARQTELRLLKARQLLCRTDEKVIQVALHCGYRTLSLFNSLFKKRFGVTPSRCRQKAGKKNGKLHCLLAGLILFILHGAAAIASGAEPTAAPPPQFSEPPAPTWTNSDAVVKARETLHKTMAGLDAQAGITNAGPPAATAATTNAVSKAAASTNAAPSAAGSTNAGPVFEVKGYELLGNTLLPSSVTAPILQPHTGPAVTFDSIRQALGELQLAYRERGYITVAVGLPQQQLTNGVVKVQVTEGRLVQINVVSNRYFTTENIMRELPDLQTNGFLNALIFQQELDRANANRDRQIYPVISPGPEPGTSALELRVKDRLPLHLRLEVNNNATPHTPELRMSLAAQYRNLWQLDHQIGLQYTFTPQQMKEGSYAWYDQPLIANYSAYYRMPMSGVNGPASQPGEFAPGETAYGEDTRAGSFGYDEATHRFRPPPPTGTSELLFFASRSDSDTGAQLQSRSVTPAVVPPGGGLQISDRVFSETLNPNEDVGSRITWQAPQMLGFDSILSFGVDYKNYRSTTAQTRVFQATIYVPEFGSTGPPFTTFPSPPIISGRSFFTSVEYLPFTIGLNASRPDKLGTWSFDLNNSFQLVNFFSPSSSFQQLTGSTNANGRYDLVTAGLTREQNISGDWGVRLHADGQLASQPLISNEQFALGGQAGVRGYHDGEVYGDNGWRVQFEPHTPYFNVGLVDSTTPMLVRFYVFLDYGRTYLLNTPPPPPAGTPGTTTQAVLFGTGFGFTSSIGEHFDFRLQLGVALHDTPVTPPSNKPDISAGDVRVTVGLGIQF